MQRYIDAELLEKSVLKPSMFDINREDVLALIAKIPTADVVPREEVEALLKENERWMTGFREGVKSVVENVKQELAREIFEEIETLIGHTAFADCWSEGGFKSDIAELKKKYVEGTDGKQA